jgi:hypothetical protein
MTLQEIDFTENTDIIVPLSDLEGTNIKRKFMVTSVPTGLDTKEMKVQGYVKHFTLEAIDLLGVPTQVEIPFTALKDYYYELVANERVKVNVDGSFNPEGTIGEYTWIRHVIKNGVLTSDEIVIAAIQRQDAMGLIKPR